MPLSDLMPSKPLPFIPRAACTLLGAVITVSSDYSCSAFVGIFKELAADTD